MLSLKDFKQISLEDKPIFDKVYAKYPPIHSDDVFTTMISWMEYGDYHYAIVDDSIVIMTETNGELKFRVHLGEPNIDLIRQVLALALKEGSDWPFNVLTNETKEWIANYYPKLKFSELRDYFDYVYQSSDLAELPGSKYSKIRNRLNKFKKNYQYEIEEISKENMDEIKEFLKRWCLWKDCESDEVLENERKAILYSIANFFELGLSGLAMRLNENVEAIAVFEKMSTDTAVVHYEKGSPDFDGIYKAINMETAKILQKDFTYINRENDMGIEGLRHAKMSYRPHHMVEVFHVKKEDTVFYPNLGKK